MSTGSTPRPATAETSSPLRDLWRHHRRYRPRVVAAVVPAPGAVPELVTLRSWVAERLGAPAAPKELHLVAAVPLLHTGKPDRRAVASWAVPSGPRGRCSRQGCR